MVDGRHSARTRSLIGTLGVAVLVSACAHVGQDEFQTEVDRLRLEMAERDQAIAQRVDGVDSRVDALESRMGAVEDGLRLLRDDFALEVERLEESLRVHLPVHFAFDDDRIDPSQLPVLDRVGGVLQKYYPEAMLTVEGMTDPSGNADYNMKLGMRLAESVTAYLIESGWSESRVRAVSYGESADRLIQADAKGPGEAGRVNRRVVVVIDHPEGAMARAVVAAAAGRGN